MALYAILFLLGAITMVLVVLAWMYVAAKRVVASTDTVAPSRDSMRSPGKANSRIWSTHVGSLDEPVGPTVAEETPMWKRHADAAEAGDPGVYKTRRTAPSKGERWDPYAASQSTASKAKSARRKPRPHRSTNFTETPVFHDREIDAYALLGISRVASTEEIERAYRRRVASIHPDKFHGDPLGQRDAVEKLKQLNLAMKVVRDRLSRGKHERGEVSS
jgi:DnaJ-domain-containing protein 1